MQEAVETSLDIVALQGQEATRPRINYVIDKSVPYNIIEDMKIEKSQTNETLITILNSIKNKVTESLSILNIKRYSFFNYISKKIKI